MFIQPDRCRAPHILIEALTGDFAGNLDSVAEVARSGLDVYAHNLETTEERTPFVRDRRATFRQSLRVLEAAKKAKPGLITKTSLMLGVGEEEEQVLAALRELRKIDVDVVTFGQYMRPTKRHMKVHAYIEPAQFDHYARVAEEMGFRACGVARCWADTAVYVASGPLVRSSFKANQLLKSAAGRRLLDGMSNRDRGIEVGAASAPDLTAPAAEAPRSTA